MNESQKIQAVLRLQQQYGNRFVQRVIAQYALQKKMKVSQPGDEYEQEADKVADAVMRMPEPDNTKGKSKLHRQAMEKEEEEEKGKVKGYYEDDIVAYEKDVEARHGNPKPGEWEFGKKMVRMDNGNNRVYQRRIFTKTTDGKKIVIDIDYTNHGRRDHVAPHHHVYVENIQGNEKSGWVKLKNPLEGQPGLPVIDSNGYYCGETE
jgi:hypothetical protein